MMRATHGRILWAVSLFALIGFSQILLESFADAGDAGGRPPGVRGARANKAPKRLAKQAQPAKPVPPPPDRPVEPIAEAKPLPPPAPPPVVAQPVGFMGGLGVAVLGGFLGSMLFSGSAPADMGGLAGSGVGMLELLLVAGLGYFVYRKFRAPAPASGYGSSASEAAPFAAPYAASHADGVAIQDQPSDDETALPSLEMMDHTFDAERFLKTVQDIFVTVQGAWSSQDTAALSAYCGADLAGRLENEIVQLKAGQRRNRMENIALRESEIIEAWTEEDEEIITVRLCADLLDYTVDEQSGAVIDGSNLVPVAFEEFWTFTRPVGPNPWKLASVQQAEFEKAKQA